MSIEDKTLDDELYTDSLFSVAAHVITLRSFARGDLVVLYDLWGAE